MNLFIVINVASQVDGQLILVQVEKATATKTEAEEFLASLPKQTVQKIATEGVEVECVCQRNVFEIEMPGYTLTKDSDGIITPSTEADRLARNYKTI